MFLMLAEWKSNGIFLIQENECSVSARFSFQVSVKPNVGQSTAPSWFCIPVCVSQHPQALLLQDPDYCQLLFSWTLHKISNLPTLFVICFPSSLLLSFWSHRSNFPGELASLNTLCWFVCDTPPAVGLSSREPEDAFLGQHPVFVKLLCRETAVK